MSPPNFSWCGSKRPCVGQLTLTRHFHQNIFNKKFAENQISKYVLFVATNPDVFNESLDIYSCLGLNKPGVLTLNPTRPSAEYCQNIKLNILLKEHKVSTHQ